MTCSRCIHKNVCKIEYNVHNCADFFELIRCEDCKHAEPRKDMENAYNCYRDPSPRCWTSHPCDYFCSEGKRREVE